MTPIHHREFASADSGEPMEWHECWVCRQEADGWDRRYTELEALWLAADRRVKKLMPVVRAAQELKEASDRQTEVSQDYIHTPIEKRRARASAVIQAEEAVLRARIALDAALDSLEVEARGAR